MADRFRGHVLAANHRGGPVTTSRVPPLEPDLVAFIEGAFPSVWALETLLALRADRESRWTSERLVTELRASGPLVNDCLTVLARGGLVATTEDGVRYAPANVRLAALCDRLEAAYRERPVSVTKAVTARRTDALKGFADSFRLGGWKS